MVDVSVIVRYHSSADFSLLEQALFSLCIQTKKVQPIVILHNCNSVIVNKIDKYLSLLPWSWSYQKKFWIIDNIDFNGDARSLMLNRGLKLSEARYIGFLDYDDIVYQNCYEVLIERLEKESAQLAGAGCRKAYLDMRYNNFFYIYEKIKFIDRKVKKLEILNINFLPIHSFLIDKLTIKEEDLYINESLHALEDYEFLLRIFSKYKFDIKAMGIPVCEYRIRNDKTHTTPFHDLDSIHDMPAWKHAREHINKLKSKLIFHHTIDELINMLEE